MVCPAALTLEAEATEKIDTVCIDVMDEIIRKICDSETKERISNLFQERRINPAFRLHGAAITEKGIKLFLRVSTMTAAESTFFQKRIVMTMEKISETALKTIRQSKCVAWHQIRKLRISSSKSHRVITRRKNYESLVKSFLDTKFSGNAATNYGNRLENAARASFVFKTKTRILECGVVVCKDLPWLCCSPDGLIISDNGEVSLLEIKCPYTRKGDMLVDKTSLKSFVPYLFHDGINWRLKESHSYYSQIQISLFVLNLNECTLYVYSSRDNLAICIKQNKEFLMHALPKIEHFFLEYFLPEISNRYKL